MCIFLYKSTRYDQTSYIRLVIKLNILNHMMILASVDYSYIYLREIKGSSIPKSHIFEIIVDRFIEEDMIEIKQGCKWTNDSKLDK